MGRGIFVLERLVKCRRALLEAPQNVLLPTRSADLIR
jgi:hypothetical protein